MEAREEANWEGTRRAKGQVESEGCVVGWCDAKGQVVGGVVDLGDGVFVEGMGNGGEVEMVESGVGVGECILRTGR